MVVWSDYASISFRHGGLSFASETLHSCAVCCVQTEQTFTATGATHRLLRSGDPCKIDIGLCVKCWSRLLRDDEGEH